MVISQWKSSIQKSTHECFFWLNSVIKGTVNVTSSAPPCKDDNAWFTMVPLKPVSDQKCWS